MSAGELISRCFHCRTEAHIAHLQTKSFAEHKALNKFYEAIVPLADTFAEAYQGRFGIITDYPDEYEVSNSPAEMLHNLRDWIDANRHDADLGRNECVELQAVIDEIVLLINSTLYKLENLK